jgi:plasmid stabilization system protein ParE
MTLPVTVRVEAAPNFLAGLEAAHVFFIEQDAESAAERFRKLKAELREMIDVVSWSPASGRPARFLAGRSAQARLRGEALKRLAEQAGLPNLREYILGRHIVLYAHAETEVVLLALKHQRQLWYSAEA